MSISGSRILNDKVITIDVDTNVLGATSDSIELGDSQHIGIFVKAKTGTHTTHEIICQIYDGANWFDTPHTVVGDSFIDNELCICEAVRGKVSVAEGGTSTVDITIIIK